MKRIFITTLLISLIGILNLTAQERIYTPELNIPANGAVDQMPDVVLDWNAVTGGNTGIIKYDIQLDTDPGFTNPVNFQTEFLTAYQASLLLFGQTYYWHVRAVDGNDVSGWSETWSFRVIRRVILSKPNDASEQSTEVTFQWIEVTGTTGYELQIDTTYYWNAINSGQTGILYGVAALDDTHAWITGAGGVVLFFDGTSWVEQESNSTKDLYCVHFLDASNGWAVGKGGTILYFNGTEWASQTSGTTNDLTGVHMLAANNGWAVGKAGVVLHYDGSAWATQYTASKDLSKVFAVDATHVWAVGKAGLVIFNDGTSWSEQASGSTRDIFSLGFTSADHGWAVGKTGLLLEFNTGTWKMLEHTLTTKDLNAVYFTGPDNAWAVGKTGTVLQYDGIEWFSQSGGTATNLNAVGLVGSIGFLAGEAGVVISYNNEAFSSPFAVTFNIPSEYLTAEIVNFPFGEQFFWRMRTQHAQAVSEWSGARSFNTQAAVELDKPNNGSVDQNLDVLLKWDKYSDLVTYEIEIDDDPAYGSPVFLTSNEISINAEQLKFGTDYFWHVRAIHVNDVSDWSESWEFSTVNSVTLISPDNDAIDVNLSPLLDWKDLTGITGYYIQVSETSDFTELLVEGTTPADQSEGIVPVILAKETSYYWRVRAENGLDISGWSPTWKFTTLPPVGIEDQTFENKINIYPNPAENTVYIQLKENLSLSLRLTITDLVGKKVFEKDILYNSGIQNMPVDVSSLKNGIYMLRIADKDNVFTKKLIIKR